jgi:hypothetical protein
MAAEGQLSSLALVALLPAAFAQRTAPATMQVQMVAHGNEAGRLTQLPALQPRGQQTGRPSAQPVPCHNQLPAAALDSSKHALGLPSAWRQQPLQQLAALQLAEQRLGCCQTATVNIAAAASLLPVTFVAVRGSATACRFCCRQAA